jgi:FKBP-type peptidyl-prolyl cis-trans isomerase FkpA
MIIKLKHVALFLFLTGCLAACKKENYVDSFDYEAQYKMDTTAIRAFINTNHINAKKIEAYGIFYEIQAPGSGTLTYAASTQITANYKGRLLDGTVFDSSAVGKPLIRQLGSLIPGWQVGVPYIQKGGKIRLFIPSYYGYGNQANGPVPANAVLDFTIDLVDATN